ncbi:MAG TPA: GGDEF domain-containing protein [Steroidobacteraceae bacterium]
MSEAVDWRKRHLDALREMETEERRWRGVEQILRRLVSRLCGLAQSSDERLNSQLQSLSAAARRDADEAQLSALFDALTSAIIAADQPLPARPASAEAKAPAAKPASPPPTPVPPTTPAPTTTAPMTPAAASAAPRWQASCDAVALLLERLGRANSNAEDLANMRAQLAAADTDVALAAVLRRVGDLVAEHSAVVARERSEAVMTLSQVTDRLAEITQFLSGAHADRERDHEDRETLNIDLLAQVSRLSDEVRTNDDLAALRALVTDRLDSVATNVRNFREREQHRFAEHAARSERMHSRLAALENESRELSRNLDLEKQRSRIDTLTRVANRVSFDERFAEELDRWKRFQHPVAILVWDIDHFKSINDACGHRGGDAVLREVAVALSGGRRGVDFFARFGGEEFVSLLVGTELGDALLVAEEMRVSVQQLRFHFHGSPIRVTVSCGLTALREGDTADSVFDRADAALYKAKNGGRNACIAA